MSNSRRSFLSKAAVAAAIAPLTPLSSFARGYEDAIEKMPKSSPPSDLRIESVTPAYIRGVNSLYIKITTNQGIIGYGEGVDAVPGMYYFVKRMGGRLRGRNPLDVHSIFNDIRKGGIFEGAQAGMYIAVLSL